MSVGSASLPVRAFLAFVAALMASICGAAGHIVGFPLAFLVVPFAISAGACALVILAPHSRFAAWLDSFVPRLVETRTAFLTAGVIVLLSIAVVIA